MKRLESVYLLVLLIGILVVSCNQEPVQTPEAVSATATISPSPVPTVELGYPDPLVICLGQEPNTLYLYDSPNAAALQVMQAIYDGPMDIHDYAFRPVILQQVPSLENGGALLQTVTVDDGMEVVNAEGEVVQLKPGERIRPSQCQSEDCVVTYTGGELQMDQLVVTFELMPDLRWSDGEVLTASDSIYSFDLNAAAETPASKEKIERTASYLALDDTRVVWTGLPGHLDQDYQVNFWTPLPAHRYGLSSPVDLPAAEFSSRNPLGWGPYAIEEWQIGEQITLLRNPYYHRNSEGLPYFQKLIFRFLGRDAQANLEALLAGDCDVLDHTTNFETLGTALLDLQTPGQIALHYANGGAWEHLDFGILHRDYDDGLNQVSGDRPNFFSDERMRQAVAKCIDRSSVAVGSTLNASAVMNTYLPITHSLYPDDVVLPEYDPAGAAALLDQMGWLLGEDGLRYATGVPFVIDGTPLQFTLVTSLDQWHKDMAKDIKTYLAACNIHVEVQTYTLEALFAPGPDGPLFGRQFDLGLFSWSFTGHPACYLYLSDAIPGEDLAKFPFSWGGWNLTGWHNPEYDVACKLARNALPGQDDYGTNHHIAQRIFAQELPVIPLFSKQEIFASRPDLCGMEFGDISQSFWNLESYGYAELCH